MGNQYRNVCNLADQGIKYKMYNLNVNFNVSICNETQLKPYPGQIYLYLGSTTVSYKNGVYA